MSSFTKRIAVIDPVGAKAGMDYYSKNLLRGFVNNNCDCVLFSNAQEGVESGISVKQTFALFPGSSLAKVVNLVSGFTKAAIGCRQRKIDVVVLHVFSSNIACFIGFSICWIFRLNVLAIVHDVESFARDDSHLFRSLIYGRMSKWISVHNIGALEELRQLLPDGYKSKNIFVAEHGSFEWQVNPLVSRSSARESLGLSQNSVYGLFFGQIKKTKGLDTLIKAWGSCKSDASLIIAGKPWKQSFDDYQELIDKVQIGDSTLKYVRYIEDTERELFFKAADFIVLPYTEIYQSGVLLMAMSYGLPALTSDIEGFSVIISDANCGLLFPPDDVNALSANLKKMIGDSVLRESLGANAMESVKTKYDWNTIAAVHLTNL